MCSIFRNWTKKSFFTTFFCNCFQRGSICVLNLNLIYLLQNSDSNGFRILKTKFIFPFDDVRSSFLSSKILIWKPFLIIYLNFIHQSIFIIWKQKFSQQFLSSNWVISKIENFLEEIFKRTFWKNFHNFEFPKTKVHQLNFSKFLKLKNDLKVMLIIEY